VVGDRAPTQGGETLPGGGEGAGWNEKGLKVGTTALPTGWLKTGFNKGVKERRTEVTGETLPGGSAGAGWNEKGSQSRNDILGLTEV
jgi:hypothetical protein